MEREDKKRIADIQKEVSKLRQEHHIMLTILGFYHRVTLLNTEVNQSAGKLALIIGLIALAVAMASTISIADSNIYRRLVTITVICLWVAVFAVWISVHKDTRTHKKQVREMQQEFATTKEDLRNLVTKTYSDDQGDN